MAMTMRNVRKPGELREVVRVTERVAVVGASGEEGFEWRSVGAFPAAVVGHGARRVTEEHELFADHTVDFDTYACFPIRENMRLSHRDLQTGLTTEYNIVAVVPYHLNRLFVRLTCERVNE